MLVLKATALYSAIAVESAREASGVEALPNELVHIILRFLAPSVGPLVRASTGLWRRLELDSGTWYHAFLINLSRPGSIRAPPARILDACPNLNRLLPVVVDVHVEHVCVSLSGRWLACGRVVKVVVLDLELRHRTLVDLEQGDRAGQLWAMCFNDASSLLACSTGRKSVCFTMQNSGRATAHAHCAAAPRARSIQIFDGERQWQLVRTLNDASCRWWSMCFVLSCRDTLASADAAGDLVLWELAANASKTRLDNALEISALAASSQLVASGHFTGRIQLWAANDGGFARNLDGHAGDVVDLVFSLDGTLLISASVDGTVGVWNPAAGKRLLCVDVGNNGSARALKAIALSSGGAGVIAVVDGEGNIVLVDAQSGAKSDPAWAARIRGKVVSARASPWRRGRAGGVDLFFIADTGAITVLYKVVFGVA